MFYVVDKPIILSLFLGPGRSIRESPLLKIDVGSVFELVADAGRSSLSIKKNVSLNLLGPGYFTQYN